MPQDTALFKDFQALFPFHEKQDGMPETGFRWLRTGTVEYEDKVLKLRLLKSGVDFF